jgi:hypothetical protein
MFLSPFLADGGDQLVFVAPHLADQRLVAGFFVARGPEDHFGEDGREINAFGSERVNHSSAIRGIGFRGDDSVFFEAAEAVGQDVGGDFFIGVEEFVEGLVAAKHHVADGEEGPAVAEHFDGCVQRAAGAALRGSLGFGHEARVTFSLAFCK